MDPKDLAPIKEFIEQLEDIKSTLDEIVENATDIIGAYGNAEAAAYHIGDAIDDLLRIE